MSVTEIALVVNTLVRHKKLKKLGIGCIAKTLKASCKVNFGTDDVMTVKYDLLEIVDTSKCKEMPFNEWQRKSVCNSADLDKVIIGNELKHWVGIGWVSEGVVTLDDLKKYPRLVYDKEN